MIELCILDVLLKLRLVSFADDNEFEEVNIVRADDFYQSHETDGGSNW